MRKPLNKRGFTLVELLMAMAVFSFVLTICLAAFIQINRLYFRGISIAKNQDSTRTVMSELTSQLQINTFQTPTITLNTFTGPNGVRKQGYYCVGDEVYYYKLGIRASDIPAAVAGTPSFGGKHVLARWVQPGFCTAAGGPANAGAFQVSGQATELVDSNTSIYQFDLSASSVAITLAYGSPDLIEASTMQPVSAMGAWPNVRCAGGRAVTFCGVSQLSSEVVTRTR